MDISQLLSIIVVTVRFEFVTCNLNLKCKAREGCHFFGCDPGPFSRTSLDKTEFPITCHGNSTSAMQSQMTANEVEAFLLMLIDLDKKKSEKLQSLETKQNSMVKDIFKQGYSIKQIEGDVDTQTKDSRKNSVKLLSLTNKHKDIAADVKSLMRNMTTDSVTMRNLKSRATKTDHEVEHLKKSLDNTREFATQLENNNKEMSKEIEGLSERVSNLTQQNAELKVEVEDLRKSRDKMREFDTQLENINKKMTREIKRLSDQVFNLTQPNTELKIARPSDLARLTQLEQKLKKLLSKTAEPTTAASTGPENPPAPTYRWGEWIGSACSKTCGSGTRKFQRVCLNRLGNIVLSSLCPSGAFQEVHDCLPKPCSVPRYLTSFHCDFQTADDVCGLLNFNYNTLMWKQNFGPLPQQFEDLRFPPMQNNQGYIYVATQGEDPLVSNIKTPKLAPGRYCIQTSIFLSRNGTSSLNIRVYQHIGGAQFRIKTLQTFISLLHGNQSWKNVRVEFVSRLGTIYVEVEYSSLMAPEVSYHNPTYGTYTRSKVPIVIAVDDIRIDQGTC